MPQRRLEHRQDHRQPSRIPADRARRGVAPLPRTVTPGSRPAPDAPLERREHHRARHRLAAESQEYGPRGLATSSRAGIGHREAAISSVAAGAVLDRAENPVLVAALALEARTCRPYARALAARRSRRPCDMADQHQAAPLSLAKRISSCAAAARTWLTVPARLRSGPKTWSGSNRDHQSRAPTRPGVRMFANRCGGGEPQRRRAESEPARAQAHLIGRFLSGNIATARPCAAIFAVPAAEGRLADPRIAADQGRRAGDDGHRPAPMSTRQGRNRSAPAAPLGVEADQLEYARSRALQIVPRRKGRDDARRILDQAVPLAAIGALPGPAAADASAELADIASLRLAHGANIAEHYENIQRKSCRGNVHAGAALSPEEHSARRPPCSSRSTPTTRSRAMRPNARLRSASGRGFGGSSGRYSTSSCTSPTVNAARAATTSASASSLRANGHAPLAVHADAQRWTMQ